MSLQLINRVLELTNEERAKAGLDPLKLNEKLANAADNHSDSMADDDFFSHTGADGSSVSDRVQNNGYQYSTVGENIAAGQTTAEDVVQAWMDSPGHRANILNVDYTEIGIGYEFLENDTGSVNYNHYWTQVFGTSLNNNNEQESEAKAKPVVETNVESIDNNTTPEVEIESEADLVTKEDNTLEDLEIDNSVSQKSEGDSNEVELDNFGSDIEIKDSSETSNWELDDSAMLEETNLDYLTGNSENSALSGGSDLDFANVNESAQVSDTGDNNSLQFYDLLADSWLGSWIEDLNNNYEEIAGSDADYTNSDGQQYLMQEYQVIDL